MEIVKERIKSSAGENVVQEVGRTVRFVIGIAGIIAICYYGMIFAQLL